MHKFITLFLLTLLLCIGSGCATKWHLDYQPSSEISAQGRIIDITVINSVAQREGLEPNRIPSRTPGKLYMTENLEDFVRNALYKEIRFIGVRTGEGDVRLRVKVQEFRMIIGVFDAQMESDVLLEFELFDRNANIILRKEYFSSGVSNNSTPNFKILNKNIRKCIEQAFQDKDFKEKIK